MRKRGKQKGSRKAPTVNPSPSLPSANIGGNGGSEDPSATKGGTLSQGSALSEHYERLKELAKGIEDPAKDSLNELLSFLETLSKDKEALSQANQELTQRLNRYAEAERIARIGNWEWDIPSNTVSWSDVLIQVLKFETASPPTTYEAFLNIVHPDDRDFVNSSVNEALYERRPYSIYHRILLPEGGELTLHSQGKVFYDEDGNPLRMQGTAQDVTELVRTAQALRESERALSTLMSNLPGMVYRCKNDPDWTMEFVSDGALSLTGYAPEDLLWNSKISYAELIHQEDRDYVWELVQEAVEQRKAFLLEYRIRTSDGKEKWVWERGTGVYSTSGELLHLEGFITDITQTKLAVKALEESEERLRAIVFHAEDAIYIKDDKGRYILANPSCARYFGKSVEDILGKTDIELFGEEDGGAIREIDEKVILSGKHFTYEASRVVSGIVKHFHTTKVPYRSNIGTVLGIIGITRDLTEIKEANEAVKRSEEYFRLLIENALDIIMVLEFSGVITYASPSVERVLGYEAKELQERNLLDFILAEDRQRVRELLQGHQTFGEPMAPQSTEFRFVHRDGSFHTIEAICNCLQEFPGTTGLILNCRDVTERKQAEDRIRESEERYRLLFEEVPIGLCAYAREILIANRALADMLGFVSPSELSGRNLADFVVSENDRDFQRDTIESALTGSKVPITEWTMRRTNGETFPAVVSAKAFHLGGKPALMIFVRDISEEKTVEEIVTRARKLDALANLSTGIAHDFNNTITALLGRVEAIQAMVGTASALSKDLIPHLQAITRTIESTKGMTKRLLAFGGAHELPLKPISVNEIINETLDLLGRTLREDVTLAVKLDENVKPVLGDDSLLQQILINLCINANDAMGEGGTLTISTEQVTLDAEYCRLRPDVKPGEYLRLTVADTGSGMTREVLSRIFEPFFSTKPKGVGTGLGLPMVYGSVTQMGGHIHVYSEPGKGTTFSVYIPTVEKPESFKESREIVGKVAVGTETIVFAEDEDTVREIMVEFLRKMGYKVHEAKDGKIAMDLITREGENIDLVILDSVMPRMSGIKVYKSARQRFPTLKFLLTSGYSLEALEDMEDAGPGMDFLAKPYSPSELVKVIREILDR